VSRALREVAAPFVAAVPAGARVRTRLRVCARDAEVLAARLPVPTYAIDDDTAVKVTDGNVEVVSEGHWKLFNA
jgi:urease accessory protein UreE